MGSIPLKWFVFKKYYTMNMAVENCFKDFGLILHIRELYIVTVFGSFTAGTHLAKCQIYLSNGFSGH